jgi:hypothetical protein
MNLFETQTNQQIFNAAIGACNELITRVKEADIQIKYYSALLRDGEDASEERAMERDITAEAMKDRRECDTKLQTIADLLETQFGISA